MKIGIPKEIKNNERRVAMTPAGIAELAINNEVVVENNAGIGSDFSNQDYIDSGAKILDTAKEVYDFAEMIIKVKEPIEKEYNLIKENQIVYTYFHFAASEKLTKAMIDSKAICIAYETVELEDKSLPLLIPMSEVAGRMSAQQGAKYIEKIFGGKGKLMGGVPGVKPAKVLILGGGIVGTEAAKMAAGLGADVIITDINLKRLRYLDDTMPANIKTLASNRHNILQEIKDADIIIGSVLIPGAEAPKLITKNMLSYMQKGTVMVDVAIDQGGCFETSKPTTHDQPIYEINGIVHYCVANMPGAVPNTSTHALTHATLKYAKDLANKGWLKACQEDKALKLGLNIIQGDVVYKAVADAFNMDYHDIDSRISI